MRLCRVWHTWSLQTKPRLLRQCWKWTAWMWRAAKSLLLLVTLPAETWWTNLVPTGRTWCLDRSSDRKFTDTFLFRSTWPVLICNCAETIFIFLFSQERKRTHPALVAPSFSAPTKRAHRQQSGERDRGAVNSQRSSSISERSRRDETFVKLRLCQDAPQQVRGRARELRPPSHWKPSCVLTN